MAELTKALCKVFLSTPSARRATSVSIIRPSTGSYFYPRPPRGGRHRGVHQAARPSAISIHAPREEGDRSSAFIRGKQRRFLSTPSARRATVVAIVYIVT